MKLDDICLVNTNVAVSDDFYRELLGFERRMRNVRFADFVFTTGPRLAMWMRPSIAETVGAGYPAAAGLPFRLTIQVPAQMVADVAGRVPGARRDAAGGVSVVDPDGFALELVAGETAHSRVSRVEIVVGDPDRTAAFLERLGFARTGSTFDAGGTELVLVAVDALPLDGFGHAGGHLMLAVELDSGDEVDRLHAELVGRGLVASGPPADFEWGARSSYFVDPDGYIWEIYAWVAEPR
ncbi:VOC family protein [Herbiconiux sp. 11R-BC]|uniref:VOC family protein n=1 Tax=Herbiconiux sp. 11R-BC TaxID=3111637 RepID=UPI003BFCB4A5